MYAQVVWVTYGASCGRGLHEGAAIARAADVLRVKVYPAIHGAIGRVRVKKAAVLGLH